MSITIRPMREEDVAEARRIFSLAFGTFVGVPDPASFGADRDYIGTRRHTDPAAAFVAEVDGEVAGSNFAVHWGTTGCFGPLTIHPDHWNKGLGRRLMEPIVDCFDAWKLTMAGLYTFPNSTKHAHLYQQYGFWPRYLTAIMSRPVREKGADKGLSLLSDVPSEDRGAVVAACSELTDSIYPGLSLGQEIRAVAEQGLGDTVLVRAGGELVGMAVCHCGPGTEAGADNCFVRFGAVRPGGQAAGHFERLLDACESLARSRGLSRLVGGVNMARHEAYRAMLEQGFRADQQGIAMHRPNEPGYSRPGAWVIDDWR